MLVGTMSNFLKEIRFMIRDAWSTRGTPKGEVDHSLARTIKESSHVTRAGGHGSAWRTNAQRVAENGAENYVKSFKKGR